MEDRSSNQWEKLAQEDEYDPFPGTSEEGPHFRIRDVFTSQHTDSGYDHGVPVDVTHYIQDKSLRHRIVLLSLSNSKLGIRVLLLRAVFVLLACLLYVVETVYYDYFTETGGGIYLDSPAYENINGTLETIALQARVLIVLNEDKPYVLWAFQAIASFIIFIEGVIVIYATSGATLQAMLRSLSPTVGIMVIIPLLNFITLLYPPILRNLFVPSFLYCWPALYSFTTAIILAVQRNAQTRPSTFRLKVITLASLFICFLFTWTCILHHFFRIDTRYNLFETYYYLMVTMSTVGYGDISPKHWTGQILITLFMFTAIMYLIPQLHALYEAFSLQQKLQNAVGFKDRGRRHILICSQALKPLVLRDFLTEFYSDPEHYEVHCVVLVEKELSTISQMYLRHPVWAKRITVLIGTPLRVSDLRRARAHVALACFIHTPRDQADSVEADQHSIMCAWAIKDFAPQVKLHVQILHPNNRLHLGVADHVVCEGELRNALLASNSVCPGISTLVTLLLHTFKPEQRPLTSEEYQLYTKCAPCEIYDSRLGESKFFHHFHGKNFLYTTVVAFRKYHVTLLGVFSHQSQQILLNPGLEYVMHNDDICFYIGVTREKYSKVGGATSINHALQGTCAKLAIYSMVTAGIDPYSFNERSVDVHDSSESLAQPQEVNDGPLKSVSFFISDPSSSEASLDTDQQLAAVETRRGLHLFKYLSNLDTAANPVVKVSFKYDHQHSGETSSTGSHDVPIFRVESHENDGKISSEPIIQPQKSHDHYRRQFSEPHIGRHFPVPHPRRRSHDYLQGSHEHEALLRARLPVIRERTISESSHHSIQRSFSDNSVVGDRLIYSSKLELVNSTSRLNEGAEIGPPTNHSRLQLPRPSLWSAHSSARNSVTSLNVDEVVELELDNIQEEAELEELEDGLCEEASSEGRSPSPDPQLEEEARPRWWKGQVPNIPYFGFEAQKCHLLYERRCHDDIMLTAVNEEGLSIVYTPSVSDDLYHFILPLRAANLPSSSLKPLVVMVKSQPPREFLDTISWLPSVYCLTGDITDVNHWLKAGITLADTVIILRDPVTPEKLENEQQEHFADSAHIMAVQKLTQLFPHVSIVTELHYRYNIRFMRFTDCDYHFMGNLNTLIRKGDHLTYLFVPQFAGGRVFCPSMLDTLLYQAYVKPYIVDFVRQLLSCKQVDDSGYLWHISLTSDLLALETYDKVFQRLVSQHRYVPLGIYRTVPDGVCLCEEGEDSNAKTNLLDSSRVASFLNTRMESLGLTGLPKMDGGDAVQSFVLPNPPPKTKVKAGDIILVIHPAHHSHPQNPPPPPPSTASHSTPPSNTSHVRFNSPLHSPPSQSMPPWSAYTQSSPSRSAYTQSTPPRPAHTQSSPPRSSRTPSSRSTRSQSTPSRSLHSQFTPPRGQGDVGCIQVTVPIECHDYDSVFAEDTVV